MSAALVNVVVGLVTTVVSGISVWAWQKIRSSRALNRKAAFFGLMPGGTCLIVMNHKHDSPGSTAQDDVHAMVEVAVLASEARSNISVRSCDEVRESNADRTEFCIGGLNSNPRTLGHLASHLPGITLRPYHAGRSDSAAIVVGGQRFPHRHGTLEHALVAKFTPPAASRPVFIICGQRAVGNRAAAHFLRHRYLTLAKIVDSADQFCVILKVISSDIYGHEMVEIAQDVTAVAFQPRATSSGSQRR